MKRNTQEYYTYQAGSLRDSAKHHEAMGNEWLAEVMKASAELFCNRNRELQEELDRLEDRRSVFTVRDPYAYTPESYIYDIEDEDFSDYREEWFSYNHQYCC